MKGAAKRLLQRLLPIFWSLPAQGEQVLYLTFDDGPVAGCTSGILDTLRRLGARGTFFLVGEQVTRFPELARRVVREGHAVGLHGLRHVNPREQGCCAFISDVRKERQIVQSVTGRVLHRPLVRPPYGYLGLLSTSLLLLRGYRVAMWSVDPLDFQTKEPDDLVSFFSRAPLKAGDVLLFHDDCEITETALEAIIEVLRRRGFHFGLLDS